MDLQVLLADLGDVDERLSEQFSKQQEGMEQLLERRAMLIEQAAGSVDSLRSATAEQRQMLLLSERAGNTLVRRLIVAKHILSRELSQLNQQQCLWGAMAAVEAGERQFRIDISG